MVFNSDNGPSIESYLPDEEYEPIFFNSFGPFNGIKRDVLEGGERTPLIARWPGKIPAGRVVESPSIAFDWLPTFTDAAGFTAPVNTDGVSLLPSLTGKGSQPKSQIYVEYNQSRSTPEYEEFAPNNRGRMRKQMQMVREGNLVALRYNIQNTDDDFEIFNVIEDPQQRENLAFQPKYKELQERLKKQVLQVRMPDSTAARPYDDALVPAITVDGLSEGLQWSAFAAPEPWLPKVDCLSRRKREF